MFEHLFRQRKGSVVHLDFYPHWFAQMTKLGLPTQGRVDGNSTLMHQILGATTVIGTEFMESEKRRAWYCKTVLWFDIHWSMERAQLDDRAAVGLTWAWNPKVREDMFAQWTELPQFIANTDLELLSNVRARFANLVSR